MNIDDLIQLLGEGLWEIGAAAAFNAGCDARLAGKPQSSCPAKGDSWELRQWVTGYDHVDRFWGIDAKWPVRRLPEVESER